MLNHVEQHTAGSPTDEKVKWTHLHPRDIAKHLLEHHEIKASNTCFKRILRANGYRKRKPDGIYDVKANKGYLSIGNSHETAAFVCDNLWRWWTTFGIHLYPKSTAILLLCDCGGANSHRHHLFEKQLQCLASKMGRRVVVAHYPPNCSKFSPIKRKLFSHVHK